MRKKKILLNWIYDRADLLSPFVKLQNDIDFVLIFYKTPIGIESSLPFTILYWDDFLSPYQLLDHVSPDEVVFFNIEDAPYQVSLNIACKERGVVTTICDHALRGLADLPLQKLNFSQNKLKSLQFFFASVTKKNLALIPKLGYLFWCKLLGNYNARSSPYLRQLRRPNRYICYTESSANFLIERDGADPSQFSLVGNPGFDDFFKAKPTGEINKEPYFLLIDQPFVSNRFGNSLLSLEEKNTFLLKLADFCHSQHHKLLVKLHPEDYEISGYIQNPAITYIKEADMVTLLHNCKAVFGFYSTLLVPAIYFKKCIVFRLKEVPIQTLWAEMGVVKMLDFYNFETIDLAFDSFDVSDRQLQEFVRFFVYKPDGNAFDRIRQQLIMFQK